MRRMLMMIGLAATVSACGGGGSAAPDSAANNEACALITDAAAIFGDGANIVGNESDAPIAADCQFTSADGTRFGEVVVFTQESRGGITPADQVATLVESWDASTETPLQPVAGLGDDARLALDLPGYQSQIVFSKGQSVVAVLGSSGDRAMSGEQIARTLAQAAAARLGAE